MERCLRLICGGVQVELSSDHLAAVLETYDRAVDDLLSLSIGGADSGRRHGPSASRTLNRQRSQRNMWRTFVRRRRRRLDSQTEADEEGETEEGEAEEGVAEEGVAVEGEGDEDPGAADIGDTWSRGKAEISVDSAHLFIVNGKGGRLIIYFLCESNIII